MTSKKIAIACQGGGSHTAFTAGVLKRIFAELEKGKPKARFTVTGLSGTSGGAICALLAWYALLLKRPAKGIELLDAFWEDISADSIVDLAENNWLVWANRLRGILPYWVPLVGQEQLATAIQRHVPFDRLPELIKSDSPLLLVGAVDVETGKFRVFQGAEITLKAILASAANPVLFKAVPIGKHFYWDGLFSQNPPIRNFVSKIPVAEKPDEIWVIQINPQRYSHNPTVIGEVEDRRNELAGNLSLNQELDFIKAVNGWVEQGWLPKQHFRPIEIRDIMLNDGDLDSASKMDRSPALIHRLMSEGHAKADQFLKSWR